MKSSVAMKVALAVVVVIAIALAINAFLTPTIRSSQSSTELTGILTDVAPGTEMPIRMVYSAGEETTMNPDKETYTVDPSIEYSDLTYRFKQLRVKGRIVIEGKLRAAPSQGR